ncbi:DUF6442 family protein [Clostridium estertheticum]|nr:DUF6442 family protein [Clostridium estertheticum]
MEYLKTKGRGIGVIGFIAIIIFVVIYNFINGLDSYSVFSIFWSYIALDGYGKYKILKEKKYLTTAIAGIVASIGFLISYILTTI